MQIAGLVISNFFSCWFYLSVGVDTAEVVSTFRLRTGADCEADSVGVIGIGEEADMGMLGEAATPGLV